MIVWRGDGVEGAIVINDTIYNEFVLGTLGCFGISAFEKIKNKE